MKGITNCTSELNKEIQEKNLKNFLTGNFPNKTKLVFPNEITTFNTTIGNCNGISIIDTNNVKKFENTETSIVFQNMPDLEEIIIPNVKFLENFTTCNCKNVKKISLLKCDTIWYYSNSLDSICDLEVYAPNLTSVHGDFFRGTGLNYNKCNFFEKLSIAGEHSFSGINNINNKILNLKNISYLDEFAFSYNEYLEKVTIGRLITRLNETAFSNCEKLVEIVIDKPTDSVPGAPWGATNAKITWNG